MLEGTPKYIISLYHVAECIFVAMATNVCPLGFTGLELFLATASTLMHQIAVALGAKAQSAFLALTMLPLGNAWLAQFLDYELCGSTLPRSLH